MVGSLEGILNLFLLLLTIFGLAVTIATAVMHLIYERTQRLRKRGPS